MDKTSSPRQRLEDFRAFLSQPQNADPAKGIAEVWSRGQVNKGGISGLVKCLDGGSARQAARVQIKQLLRDNHIEITANIRRALPSRTAPGDAAALSQLLNTQALPLKVNDLGSLAPHLQHELKHYAETAANGKSASLKDFLMQDSGPARRALLALLSPTLEAQADDMAVQAFDTFARGLMFGYDIDGSMDIAFKELMEQFTSQQSGDALNGAVHMLSGMLDGMGNTEFATEARKSLEPSLKLAAFVPVLFDALEKRQKLFQMAVQDLCTVRDAQPEQQSPDPYSQQPAKTVIDSGQMWRMRAADLASRLVAESASQVQ